MKEPHHNKILRRCNVDFLDFEFKEPVTTCTPGGWSAVESLKIRESALFDYDEHKECLTFELEEGHIRIENHVMYQDADDPKDYTDQYRSDIYIDVDQLETVIGILTKYKTLIETSAKEV